MERGSAMNPFEKLVAAINKGTVSDVEPSLHLCDEMQIDITDRKVDRGELTVVGHVIVSKSDTEVLRILLRRADINANFVELSFDENIPILHLAAYVGNLEAVKLLCDSQDIDLDATLSMTRLTALHMSVKGGDPNIVRQILLRAHKYRHQDNSTEWFSGFLNQKDILGMTALHYAAWEGDETMVAQMQDFEDAIDVNPKHYQGITPLHLASWNNRLGVVKKLLAHPQIDPRVPSNRLMSIMGDLNVKDRWQTGMQQSLHDLEKFLPNSSNRRFRDTLVGHFPSQVYSFRLRLEDKIVARIGPLIFPDVRNDYVTALHCAAFAGHSEIVLELVRAISTKAQARKTLNAVDDHLMTPLHYAIIGGDTITVEELSINSMVRGNHEEMDKDLTPLDVASVLIRHAKDPAIVQEYKGIISVLSERQDVQTYMGDLDKQKQVFVNAVNSVMLVAALITSITYQGWLTPPNEASNGVANFNTMNFVLNIYVYWDFNVISLCCSVSIVLIGAAAMVPREAMTRKAEANHIRKLLVWMLVMLYFAVLCLIWACMTASLAEWSPNELKKRLWEVSLMSVVGACTCLIGMYFFLREVYGFFQEHASCWKN